MTQANETDAALEPRAVTLVPGQRYIVFFNAAAEELPSADALGDLRYHARKQINTDVLGPTADAVVTTLLQAVIGGVVGNAAWLPFPAAAEFIERWRSRHREGGRTADSPSGVAAAAAKQVTATRPEPAVIDVRGDAESGWTVQLKVLPGQHITAQVTPSKDLVELEVHLHAVLPEATGDPASSG